MKNFVFRVSLLVFMLSLLSGFYSRLPLIDNLIRSFVVFVLFYLAIWIIMLVYVQTLAAGHKNQTDAVSSSESAGDPNSSKVTS